MYNAIMQSTTHDGDGSGLAFSTYVLSARAFSSAQFAYTSNILEEIHCNYNMIEHSTKSSDNYKFLDILLI